VGRGGEKGYDKQQGARSRTACETGHLASEKNKKNPEKIWVGAYKSVGLFPDAPLGK